jgi:hypothetical protein
MMRGPDILAPLCGVGDRVVHVGDAAFIDQVDDQLHFVQALEIGHFRRVTGFHQRFETGADQLDQAAAQNNLLAEQVGFALFLEGGLDDAGAAAADAAGVGQRQIVALPDASWWMAIRHGTPPPFWYSPRTVWPGPFGAIITTSTVSFGSISRSGR